MSYYNVFLYHTSKKELWNHFALHSNQDSFLFQRDFMDYHKDRFQDFSLMVYKNETLVALLPAHREGDAVYTHFGLTYGGLIHAKTLKTSEYIAIFKVLLEFLHNQNIGSLTLKELLSIYLHNSSNNPLQYVLFKSEADLCRVDLHSVIDMRHKAYSKSRKKGIKRGQKANLRVEESPTFEAFWNEILIPNLGHKHGVKPVHSLDEITLLKSRFPNNIRQFNVYLDDKLVAGTTIFETENVAHSQYISGNADKNELGSLDVLHQYLLEQVYSDKKYFDFGTSNIDAGAHINEGLLYWKEGFSAQSIPQGFYKIATKNYKHLEAVFI